MGKEERKLYLYNLRHKIDEKGILLKRCSVCEEWFICDEEYFYKNKSNHIDGLHPYCKQCSIKKFQKWNIDNPNKNSENSRIYSIEHKEERKEWNKYYYIRTKEERKQYLKNWQENNPEKLKGYSSFYSNKKHDISNKEWISCKEYFNNTCVYCGLPITEHFTTYKGITKQGDFHKEHVNCDGEGNLNNCVPSCKTCNASKHKENMEEWYVGQEFYSKEKLDKIHQWINKDYKQFAEEKENLELLYIIKQVKNTINNKFHFELWSKDKNGECEIHLATENKKKELDIHIQKYFSDKDLIIENMNENH